jgi:ubiquinone/menaquinone biosynthesis C-methylase UbiE
VNVYQQFVFPRLLDRMMQGDPFSTYRRSLLADVSGDVLEIGFGTGLNLAHYPERVQRLTTVEPNAGMNSLARRRIEAGAIAVDQQLLSSEALPMAAECFDSVVSTWTLCSIAQVEQALSEIWRVLRPGGRFFFIEHGLAADDPTLQRWQHRINPLQNLIGDGCNLNRDMAALVRQVFPNTVVDQFYMENMPKIGGYMYRGVATK